MFLDPYVVYGLEDPRYGTFRYIGITKDPYECFQQHLRCTEKDNAQKNAWIQELRAQFLVPLMRILAVVEGRENALRQEAFWIQKHKSLGAPFLNSQMPDVSPPYPICTTTVLIYLPFYRNSLLRVPFFG